MGDSGSPHFLAQWGGSRLEVKTKKQKTDQLESLCSMVNVVYFSFECRHASREEVCKSHFRTSVLGSERKSFIS